MNDIIRMMRWLEDHRALRWLFLGAVVLLVILILIGVPWIIRLVAWGLASTGQLN